MTEDEQTKNAFTRIEDVSPQNVPLIAGPRDVVEGFDELNGTIYRSESTGELYTLYPETKTKQERPIITTAKAVGEYLSNPSLPSLEEASEFAKEAVKGAYEPFRKIASGDSPTYGDLADTLPVALSGTAAKVFTRDSRPDIVFQREILDDTEFEPLDEKTLFPKTKTPAPPAKFMGDEALTPEEGLASIKSDNLYETTQYDPTTMLGQIAYNKKKVLDSLKDKELLKLAQDLPHYNDKDYWNFLDANIKPVANYLGVEESDFISLLKDVEGYYPAKKDPRFQEMTEKPLPEKTPLGPRAGTGPERPSDKKAEALGFKDTVYHTSTKKGPFVDFSKEFTEFDLASSTGSDRTSQDLLGVHVGTARAAAERNLYVREDPVVGEAGDAKGYTMELRARTTDPVTKQEISKMFKKKPEELFNEPTGPFTEMDVNTLIREYEDLLYPANTLPPADSREVAAVNFRRELAREGFTHIPYINDVEDPGSTSLIMLVDRPKDSPAVLRDVRAQFDPKKVTSPDLRFAEGGMVEDQQMNKLMQEGGIADDGMDVEPVTGNEIPPGSMASEVRDDIDAKLSEGEYVVPADVVRFFGVRFFEDLRNQAKQGLQEMDADGRIGGAPVDAQGIPAGEGDEELTPEEEQMLMEALGGAGGGPAGMAYGGMVQQPAPTPYQDQATMYQMPEGMGGPMGMQEGGLTRDGTSTFDRTQFTIPEASGAFESRKYINPTTGEEKTVQFLNGVPMGLVPEGFVPWTPALAEQAQSGTQAPTTQTPKVEPVKTEREGRDRETGHTTGSTGEGSLSYDRWAEKNADAITSDPYGFGVNALSDKSGTNVGKGLGVAGALVGGPVGAVIGGLGLGARATSEVQNIAEARAALGVMEAKGLKGTAQYNDLEARIETKIDDLPAGQRIAVRTGVVATGTGYASAALGATSKPEAATPAATPSKGTTTTQKDTSGMGQVDPGLAKAVKDKADKASAQNAAADKALADKAAAAKASTQNAAADKGLVSKAEAQTSKEKAAQQRAAGDITRRAEGGLISKPEKTARTKKGLAS